MPLQSVVDSLDGIDEAVQGFYEEKDGKYYLSLDGDIKEHPAVKPLQVAYERDAAKRKEQSAKLTSLQAKLDGLPEDFTPEQYNELRDKVDEIEATNGHASGEVEADVRKAVAKAEREAKRAERERATALEQNGQLMSGLQRLLVENSMQDELLKANVDPRYLPAVKALIREDFKVVEDSDSPIGFAAVAGPDELTPKEYIKAWSQADENKIYISAGSNSGGSAKGSSDAAPASGDNPFKKDSRNLTQQNHLITNEPETAKRLAREAGVVIPPHYFQQ